MGRKLVLEEATAVELLFGNWPILKFSFSKEQILNLIHLILHSVPIRVNSSPCWVTSTWISCIQVYRESFCQVYRESFR